MLHVHLKEVSTLRQTFLWVSEPIVWNLVSSVVLQIETKFLSEVPGCIFVLKDHVVVLGEAHDFKGDWAVAGYVSLGLLWLGCLEDLVDGDLVALNLAGNEHFIVHGFEPGVRDVLLLQDVKLNRLELLKVLSPYLSRILGIWKSHSHELVIGSGGWIVGGYHEL